MTPPTVPSAPEVARFVDLIGETATLALIEARGGTRIAIPATEAGIARSYLADLIGKEALTALSREFGSLYIQLPLARNWRAYIYLARGGMSHPEIALKVGLTESYVQRLALADYQPMPNSHAGARRPRRSDDGQLPLPL